MRVPGQALQEIQSQGPRDCSVFLCVTGIKIEDAQ
jgi:hypothetical protein